MQDPQSNSKPSAIALVPEDNLKHFANDGPAWKLGALFIAKLPAILRNLAFVAAAIWEATHRWWT
jgi:hypothetical protein